MASLSETVAENPHKTGTNTLIRWINYVGAGFLFLMVCLIFVDVILRYFFHRPIIGDVELTQLMLVIVVFLGVAYAQLRQRHVAVELFVIGLPQKGRVIVNSISYILSIGLISLIIWGSSSNALWLKDLGTDSGMLRLPIYFFAFLIPFGCALFLVIIIRDFIHTLAEGIKIHLSLRLWLLIFGITVAFIAVIIWLHSALSMTSVTQIGVVGIILLGVLFFLGMPVGLALAGAGFLGIFYIRGLGVGLQILGGTWYTNTANYNFSVIPFFILMGMFGFYTKLSKDLYEAAYKWVGHLPGGLAMTTIAACAAFGAISGDTTSTAVTMGSVALPEMKRFKYNSALATGCVAVGGTLAALIPPSLGFIIYGLLVEQSIGTLFIAGVIPGLFLAFLYIMSIYFRCRLNSNLGPAGPQTSFREKLISLKNIWAVLILFILVIGGIYTGLFTATEAGAIGAIGALVIGLALKRLSRAEFFSALVETTELVSMIFIILGGAAIFGYFLALTKIPMSLASIVSGLALPRLAILIVILFVYLLLGCIMPALPMLILTVPIFFPVIKALGYDPIWYGVIMVMMMDLAVITPPVGINIFVIKGVARDVPMNVVFRGVMPFVLVAFVFIALLIAFPQIATFLPQVLNR